MLASTPVWKKIQTREKEILSLHCRLDQNPTATIELTTEAQESGKTKHGKCVSQPHISYTDQQHIFGCDTVPFVKLVRLGNMWIWDFKKYIFASSSSIIHRLFIRVSKSNFVVSLSVSQSEDIVIPSCLMHRDIENNSNETWIHPILKNVIARHYLLCTETNTTRNMFQAGQPVPLCIWLHLQYNMITYDWSFRKIMTFFQWNSYQN